MSIQNVNSHYLWRMRWWVIGVEFSLFCYTYLCFLRFCQKSKLYIYIALKQRKESLERKESILSFSVATATLTGFGGRAPEKWSGHSLYPFSCPPREIQPRSWNFHCLNFWGPIDQISLSALFSNKRWGHLMPTPLRDAPKWEASMGEHEPFHVPEHRAPRSWLHASSGCLGNTSDRKETWGH